VEFFNTQHDEHNNPGHPYVWNVRIGSSYIKDSLRWNIFFSTFLNICYSIHPRNLRSNYQKTYTSKSMNKVWSLRHRTVRFWRKILAVSQRPNFVHALGRVCFLIIAAKISGMNAVTNIKESWKKDISSEWIFDIRRSNSYIPYIWMSWIVMFVMLSVKELHKE
jgi:hypothetical protein